MSKGFDPDDESLYKTSKEEDDFLSGMEEIQQMNEEASEMERLRQERETQKELEDELDSAKSPDDY